MRFQGTRIEPDKSARSFTVKTRSWSVDFCFKFHTRWPQKKKKKKGFTFFFFLFSSNPRPLRNNQSHDKLPHVSFFFFLFNFLFYLGCMYERHGSALGVYTRPQAVYFGMKPYWRNGCRACYFLLIGEKDPMQYAGCRPASCCRLR